MKIRELYDTKNKWTQGAYGRNSQGESVSSSHHSAVAWCLYGAIGKCYRDDNDFISTQNKIVESLGTTQLMKWNDDPARTFEDIKDLVDALDI